MEVMGTARDYTKARIYHWLHSAANPTVASGIIESEKWPLQSRVWYTYKDQGDFPNIEGSSAAPTGIGRRLDDGSSQVRTFEYNARGATIKAVDPAGRETVYVYGTGSTPDADPANGTGIDLLQIKQKNGSNYDLLASFTYSSQHLPLTVTDAAGKTTTFTYNSEGQVLTVETPARSGITENRTTTYSYDSDGYLQGVTGPATGATSEFTYDSYGRVDTTTDSEGYVLAFDYDALDRPTKVTYPDTTFEEVVYNRLDAEKTRDRLGRWTHTLHDALGRPVASRDPAGRTTALQWCSCGSLDKLVDARGNATSWERDVEGRVTKEIRADNSTREYTYETTTSRLKKVKDGKRRKRSTRISWTTDSSRCPIPVRRSRHRA
jgi:YD repeat-containing protein